MKSIFSLLPWLAVFILFQPRMQAQLPCNAFGQNGIALAPFSHQTSINDITVDPWGGVLATGYYSDENGRTLAVMSFDQDGRPNWNFGKGGITSILTLSTLNPDEGYAVAATNDATVFAAGGGEDGPVLVGLNRHSGLPKSAFGSSGVMSLNGNGPATGLVVFSNQAYVLYPTAVGFSVTAVRTSGVLLTGFGSAGTASFATPDSVLADRPLQLARQSDGKFLVAVTAVASHADSTQVLIYRLNSDGSLDTSWSGDGIAELVELGPFFAQELLIQDDGKIILVGGRLTSQPENSYAVSQRLDANGNLDTGYGTNGRSISGTYRLVNGASLSGDGEVRMVGAHFNLDDGLVDFLVSGWDSSGSVSGNLGVGGFDPPTQSVLQGTLAGLVQMSDGTWMAGGYVQLANQTQRGVLVKLAPDGSPMTSFGQDGYQYADLVEQAGVLVSREQSDGKILGAGLFAYTSARGGHAAPAMARFHPDGSPDSTFGFRGVAYTDQGDGYSYFHSLKVLSDQRIFAAGRYNNGQGFLAARYLPDGAPDSTFGEDGFVNYRADCFDCATLSEAAVVDNQGKYLMVGEAAFGFGNIYRDGAIMRLNFDGTRDSSFGSNGVVQVMRSPQNEVLHDVQVLPDDDILVCGSRSYFDNTGPKEEVFVMKFRPSGGLRTSFGDTAIAAFDLGGIEDHFYHLLLQDDGKILVSYQYQTDLEDSSRRIGIMRLEEDGDLDTDFGQQGRFELDLPNTENYQVDGLEWGQDGNLLLAGSLKNPQGGFTFLARIDSMGRLIESFGDNGIYLIEQPALTNLNGSPLVLGDGRVLLPGSINNYDGFALTCHDLEATAFNIQAKDPASMLLFPNPASDVLNIRLESPLEYVADLSLLDMQGRELYHETLSADTHQAELAVDQLISGIYLLKLETGEGYWVKRWIKE